MKHNPSANKGRRQRSRIKSHLTRPIRACVQCRARKVKCDQKIPCATCVEREEGGLCSYHQVESPGHNGNNAEVGSSWSSWTPLGTSGSEPHESIIRPFLEDDDLEGAKGMDRAEEEHGAAWTSTVIITPAEVMHAYEVFLSRPHEWVPLVSDLSTLSETIEGMITTNSLASQSVPSPSHASQALTYAVLASGVQYSEMAASKRVQLMSHCASKHLECPTPLTIQTLLVLGHIYQNNFQCHASWSLLGLTIRLADGIDVKDDQGAAKCMSQVRDAIGWQETLLCMCLGKSPSQIVERPLRLPSTCLGYAEAMRFLCAKIGRTVRSWAIQTPPLTVVLDEVRQVSKHFDALVEKFEVCDPAITPTLLYQRKALRLHTSYSVSYLCRPAFIRQPESLLLSGTSGPDAWRELMQISAKGLFASLEQYVDLLALTSIALRSWALIYNGLGASLMLGVLGEFRRNQAAQSLTMKLLDFETKFEENGPAIQQGWRERVFQKLRSLTLEATRQENGHDRTNDDGLHIDQPWMLDYSSDPPLLSDPATWMQSLESGETDILRDLYTM